MIKSQAKELLQSSLAQTDTILSAKLYGSWLYNETAVDCDVAVVVASRYGVVPYETYQELYGLRNRLVTETGYDIDLIPHTEDEFTDIRSPLWYPRYNPSLVFGETIKGQFKLQPITKRLDTFSFADLTAYVLYDNRTICRRQLTRTLDGESGRIFVSKLLHGAGNALTYHSCEEKVDYICSPSDMENCFHSFDEIYGVDSAPALAFLRNCKRNIDFRTGCGLINWYESLVTTVLDKSKTYIYSEVCHSLEINNAA